MIICAARSAIAIVGTFVLPVLELLDGFRDRRRGHVEFF
jgi:hypothetical protein